jgi:hypothetical protein
MNVAQLARAAAATVLWILPSYAVAEISTLRALLVEYRCQLVNRLERIHEFGDRASARDRFIAVTAPEHPHGYVQCMFIHGGLQMLCEASSGFYYDKVGAPRTFWLASGEIAALAGLGFSTDDSKGNFRMEFGVAEPPDFNRIADLILTALHDGYGARAKSGLRFNAPFAHFL